MFLRSVRFFDVFLVLNTKSAKLDPTIANARPRTTVDHVRGNWSWADGNDGSSRGGAAL